jgi:flagellar hook assembly protein FlgD
MAYMRMQESKFWGWVVVSLVVGLGAGLIGMYFFTQYSSAKKVEAARTELSGQIADATTKSSALETRLASAEASLAALTEANAQLTTELEAAKANTRTSSTTTTSSALTVVSREIQPDSVTASHTVTMTAKVKGAPDKVTMRVTSTSGGFDQTYSLKKVSTSGSTETWRASYKAPAKKGEYRYYATATTGNTKVTMPGASPSTLTVR